MNFDVTDAESTVSGNQATIPARIRHELDIDDGDLLKWSLQDDGSVRVEVVQQGSGTFASFDGYPGTEETNAASDHDTWGVGGQIFQAVIDTSVLFAAAYRRGGGHVAALPILHGIDAGMLPEAVVIDFVLAETLNGLGSFAGHANSARKPTTSVVGR